MLRHSVCRWFTHAFVIADSSTSSSIAAASKFAEKISVGYFKREDFEGVGAPKILSHVIEMKGNNVADTMADQIVAATRQIGDITHIIGSTSSIGKDVLPRVGGILGVQPVSDCVEVVSSDTCKRSMYAGNVLATVQLLDDLKIVLIRPTAFPVEHARTDKTTQTATTHTTTPTDSLKMTFISNQSPTNTRVDLSSASTVVAGGRGLKSKENFEKILSPLCSKLNAGLGASRAAVDAGFAPNETQIGQTGKVVAPNLYIAVGISGAIQHLAGMKDSRTIVAINKDPDAPIFQIADYGIVGDLNTIVPELVDKL